MKTLKLFIKTSLFNKINDFMCSILSNKSLMEEAIKCLFRTSLRSTHSTRMCFTVSGHFTHASAYQFSIPTSISFGHIGVQKLKKVKVAYILDAPKQKNLYMQPIAHQISTSQLDQFRTNGGCPKKQGLLISPGATQRTSSYIEPQYL